MACSGTSGDGFVVEWALEGGRWAGLRHDPAAVWLALSPSSSVTAASRQRRNAHSEPQTACTLLRSATSTARGQPPRGTSKWHQAPEPRPRAISRQVTLMRAPGGSSGTAACIWKSSEPWAEIFKVARQFRRYS